MKIRTVPIEKINVGDRHREDLGDIEKLSQSLNEVGLLQPIGVDKYYTLIFGQRRLAAAELLGWESIDCHIVNIGSIVLGEYSENAFRKDFTASERLAIAEAVRLELGSRQGKRPDKVVAHVPQVAGGKTRDVAAEKAGFSSTSQYRKAKAVVEMGAPETVAAMDSGELSIAAAETVARLPKDKQADVVAMPKDRQRTALRDAREKEAAAHRDKEVVAIRTFEAWVKDVGDFTMQPAQFWDAASRHILIGFEDKIERALNCLMRIKSGNPKIRRPESLAEIKEITRVAVRRRIEDRLKKGDAKDDKE